MHGKNERRGMVSTIVDGIDNGAVEYVFVFKASHSLFRLIQSLGRICPARQNHDYATLHIFDTGDMIGQDPETLNVISMYQGEEYGAKQYRHCNCGKVWSRFVQYTRLPRLHQL